MTLDTAPWHAEIYAEQHPSPMDRAPTLVTRPMPASREDLPQLKALLRWAKAEQHKGANREMRERALIDALAKAITCIEEAGSRATVASWICGALLDSMRREPTLWVVTKRDLQTWSMDQLAQEFPPETQQ